MQQIIPGSFHSSDRLQNEKLQARIDVPLTEASKLSIGQKVEISCSFLPNLKFNGQVTRIVGEADLQRSLTSKSQNLKT